MKCERTVTRKGKRVKCNRKSITYFGAMVHCGNHFMNMKYMECSTVGCKKTPMRIKIGQYIDQKQTAYCKDPKHGRKWKK